MKVPLAIRGQRLRANGPLSRPGPSSACSPLLWCLTHGAGGFSMLRRPASKSEWEKTNPLDSRTVGRTRAPLNSRASASFRSQNQPRTKPGHW